jgi:hypothetical protein
MPVYHKTRTGGTMLIAQMDDKHLLNTIKMNVRHLAFAKAVLSEGEKTSEFFKALYPEQMTERTARTVVADWDIALGPYVIEANIRGLDIDKEIQNIRDLFSRSEALEGAPGVPIALITHMDDIDANVPAEEWGDGEQRRPE